MCSEVFCKLFFFDRNSHFLILFVWYRFNYLSLPKQWEKAMAPHSNTLLPGKSHGWRSLVGCSPWGREELDRTEQLPFHFSLSCIGERNGNPLQCSCWRTPGSPKDGGAWWAAVYGIAQSQTRLMWLSSSSSSLSNGWVIIPQFWQMMGEGLKEIFSLLWLSEALNIIFQDKEYVTINLSLVLITYPSQEFSWLHLWKPKSLSVQKVDSLMQGKVKRQGVVYAVHWKKKKKKALVLVSCDTHSKQSWEYLMMETRE